MPNIVLVGFKERAEDMRSRILNKIRAIGEKDMDSPLIVTGVYINKTEGKDIAGDQCYVRIESSSEDDFDKIVDILRTLKIHLILKMIRLRSESEIRP